MKPNQGNVGNLELLDRPANFFGIVLLNVYFVATQGEGGWEWGGG